MLRIIFFFIFLNFFFNIATASNIAYIDLNFIINNSVIGKKFVDKLEITNNQNINLIKKEQTKLNKERDEIEKIKNILSKDELNSKILSFNEKLENFTKKQKLMSDEFKNLSQLETTNLFKKINPIIEKYMLENNIDIILKKENIYISNSNYDITSKLIDLINKKFEK
jgi:Skp family chaperone for outer membrane proteins